MRLTPAQASDILRRIDHGRVYLGRPLGLRDSALLALIAAGLSAVDVANLKASDITLLAGRVTVTIAVHDGGTENVTLSGSGGNRLLAWLHERRLWGTAAPVFTGHQGIPYTSRAISAVLDRYRNQRKKPR
jgi:integrase